MLIHLTNQLQDSISLESGLEESALLALQNIAQARAQGDHIISADKEILNFIIKCKELSPSTIGIYKKISGEQSQFGRLRHKLSTYVLIKSLNGDRSSENIEGQRIITLPLARFQRNDITQPAFVIGENLLDCQLLISYSSWFSRYYKGGLLPSKLKATLFPGGGDTTDRALKYLVDEQRYFALCITDSDQTHPGGAKGQTTQKCSAIKCSEIAYHTCLPVKSIENLFSIKQIEAILDIEHTRNHWKPNLSRLQSISNSEAWSYFPFKSGVNEVFGPCKSNSLTTYWRGRLNLDEARTVDDFIFPPMSSKLLQWGVDHFQKNSPICIKDDGVLFGIWEDISLLISSWACSTDPIRV